jgi:poly(A) polymerase
LKFYTLPAEDEIIKIIQQASESLNVQAYLVGGFVRDRLLGRICKDIDIVCLGNGIQLAEMVSSLIKNHPKVTVYHRFGTAMLRYNDLELEFVGARKESYSEDSRKPFVESGSLEEDQYRRDFTINALAVSLQKDDYGLLLDPFSGLKHLEEKIIQTPLDPDRTFSDDPLRMMRAIRFASQLHFEIHPETLNSIANNCKRIEIVSRERIIIELEKILLSNKPSMGLDLLYKTGLLSYILPELVDLRGVEYIDGKGHKDNFYHTLEVIDNLRQHTNDIWLIWAAVFHDIAKPATKKFSPETGWTFHGHEYLGSVMLPKIFRRLKLPLDHKLKYVQKLVALHLRPISLTKENITDSAIRRLLFDAGDEIDDLMLLCAADITSKNADKKARFLENYKIVKNKLAEVEEKDQIRNWQPPISGELIMSTFNIRPGREVGIIKNAIREAILDGEIQNEYESAYILMLQKGQELGLAKA